MLKINEAAKLHSEIQPYGVWKDDAIKSFKAGVEFAQRWISVEDELPKYEGVDFYVLMKNDSFSASVVTLGLIEGIDDIENVYQYSTHWRPIKLK